MSSLLRRHLWLIGIIAALSVAAAAWLASREAPEYQASAMIRLTRMERPVGANIDPMLSEMVVLTGRTVIGNAVDREGLRLFSSSTGAPAGFVEHVEVSLLPQRSATIDLDLGENQIVYGTEADRRTAAYGEPIRLDGASFVVPARPREGAATLSVVPRDRAIDYALENLTSITDPSTGGVQVVFTSTERRIASRAVNAIVEAYQTVSVETARQDVRRRRAFLEEELRATDSLLAVAQAELGSLRGREEGAQLQARQQADVELYESVLNRILEMRRSGEGGDPSSLMSLPDIAVDPVARRLYSQVLAYRMERQGMLTGSQARTPQHPDVQRLNTLIASTEESLVEAARDRIRSLRAQAVAAGPAHSPDSATADERAGAELDDLLLPRNLEALQQTAEELRDKYREARLEESSETGPVEIVQLSTRTTPVRSIAWIKLLLGLAAGLVLGSAAAVARERFANSIGHRREVREIEETTPVPNLAVIPEVTPSLVEPVVKGDFRPGPLQSAGMEAYRTLRANLVSSRWGIKTLVVTSAHPGEGKTTTSTNLAATYARQGLKVVLVECDLRRPSLGRYFGISKDTDLMDVLFENRDWRGAIQLTRMPGLYVLLGEKSFPRAGESLGGPEMKRLLAELSSEYDMVILDTSPLLVSEDATALGPIVDGVLLVVRATRTDRKTVEAIVRKLRLAGANVVGTILNDPEGASSLG